MTTAGDQVRVMSLLPLDDWPDPEPPRNTGPDGEPLSADRRRTLRQADDIKQGRHPLTGGPLHPYATPETCAPDAPKGAPFTCGSCRFRQLMRWHDRTYPKCVRELLLTDRRTVGAAVNISHGGATDVRGWWPACPSYEAGDQSLSSDASRVIP